MVVNKLDSLSWRLLEISVKVLFNILGEFIITLRKMAIFRRNGTYHSPQSQGIKKFFLCFHHTNYCVYHWQRKKLPRILTLIMYDLLQHIASIFFYPYLKQQNPPQPLSKKEFQIYFNLPKHSWFNIWSLGPSSDMLLTHQFTALLFLLLKEWVNINWNSNMQLTMPDNQI